VIPGLRWFQEDQRGYQPFRCFGIGGGGSPGIGHDARERGHATLELLGEDVRLGEDQGTLAAEDSAPEEGRS